MIRFLIDGKPEFTIKTNVIPRKGEIVKLLSDPGATAYFVNHVEYTHPAWYENDDLTAQVYLERKL